MSEKQEEKIDWSYVSEMEQRLDELEREKLQRVKVFNPKELVRRAKEIREISDDDLGVIRYVLLSYDDLNEIIEKYPDNKDRSVQLLFRQLFPANKDLAVEDIHKMPYEVVVRLLTKLQKEGGFFQTKVSQSGSTSTQEPKPSDSSPTSTVTHFK
jgi:hypothetical protein